ncbi:MAG: EAL domain-containing protein [Nitrospirales bacterium]|nr:EAL domain-containing protein [Nitrospirales bacterium]
MERDIHSDLHRKEMSAPALSGRESKQVGLNETLLFRTLYDETPLVVLTIDRFGRIQTINKFGTAQLGYSPGELIGEPVNTIIHEEDRKVVEQQITVCLQEPARVMQCELRSTRKDGTVLWMKEFIRPLGRAGGAAMFLMTCEEITDLRKTGEMLRASEELYRKLFETAKDGIVLLDPNTGRITHVNPHVADMLGHLQEELIGKSLPEIGVLAAGAIGPAVLSELEDKGYLCYEDIVLRTKDGRRVIADIYLVSREKAFHCTIRNVTERRLMERALRERERQQRAILSTIPDIAWLKDRENRFVAVNEAFGTTCGMKPEELASKTDFDIWPEEAARKYRADDEEVMTSGKRRQFEELLVDRKGEKKWLEVIKTPVLNEEGAVIGMTGIARDITGRKQMEETLHHQAYHDILTGLPNKTLFVEYITLELAHTQRSGEKLAVLLLDLDQFKSVNDTFGHSMGDALLVAVAERLRTCMRETDTVARIGGDTFTILLPHIALAEDAARIAQKIIEEFQQPFTVGGIELFIAVSVGISISPPDGEDAETLLKYADIALYHAKEQGRSHYQFYNPSINSRSLKRMRLENRLRRILDRKELVVHYQPQVDIATGKVVCVEALVRWQHPELGLLGPDKFISLAEEMGLIIPMGEWVLQTTCAQNRAWQDAGYPPLCVSVNLSARQFSKPDLMEMVMHAVHRTGLSPWWLELEITEGTAMRDMDHTVTLLHRLKDEGIRISIDDFGTGYSSLSYLKKMPIQKLKIDQSFISGLPGDPDDKAIVDAVIAMAHSMKLKVTAEGVETEEQLSFLRSRGCNEAQGYLLGKPMPAQESARYLLPGGGGSGATKQ